MPLNERDRADYAACAAKVQRLLGIDLTAYKPDQMHRRLVALAHKHGASSLAEFGDTMTRNAQALAAFKDFFTINVSEFLRDPPRWNDLVQRVLPDLYQIAGRRPLKVWSAGCSIGAEPYTLAMVLDEALPGAAHTITATDIDDTILARARAGAGYREPDLRNLSEARRSRFFTRQADGSYAVKDVLKRRIRFQRHDLLTRPPDSGYHLIVCRNVVIYFTEEAKKPLYERFLSALAPGGILFVGGTEVVTGAREIGFEPFLTSFYRRPGARLVGAA